MSRKFMSKLEDLEYTMMGLTDEEIESERLWRTRDRYRLELMEEVDET
jgi:hypothetical protein